MFCTDSKESDFECQLILQTDASDRGVGAVLSQRSDDGHEHPIAYWSENLLPQEQRYSKLGVAAFSVYLLGQQFSVETDHHSLVWMERLQHTNNRLVW